MATFYMVVFYTVYILHGYIGHTLALYVVYIMYGYISNGCFLCDVYFVRLHFTLDIACSGWTCCESCLPYVECAMLCRA